MLLERGNESGIARIDAAMDADAALVEDGCDMISDFLQHRGRHVDAFHYQQRMAREATRSAMAQAEQQRLSAADRLSPVSANLSTLRRWPVSLARSLAFNARSWSPRNFGMPAAPS